MQRNLKLSIICALAACIGTTLGTPAMAAEDVLAPSQQIQVSAVSEAPFMVADAKADKKERKRLRRWREQVKAKLKTASDPAQKTKLKKLASDIHKKIIALNAKLKGA
ncbi:MAG: hypothetical protein JWM80_5835 [Cyanobacteria bacterium RYN_339]|nr:hypothetical protein [Cyanobacteria bacterium RYN_339]